MKKITAMILGLCMMVLAGCGSTPTPEQSLLIDVLARRAAVEYIDHRSNPAKSAERVIEVCDQLLAVTDGDTTATVTLLQELVREAADFDGMDPIDRADAEMLLSFVSGYVQAKLGEDLDAQKLVVVRDIFMAVRDGAVLYQSSLEQ